MSSMERYTIREVADMSIEDLKWFFAFEADEPEHIGVSRAKFRASFEKIPYMRSRFTVIDIAFRCGWMEEWLDKLFGKGGIWEIK